MPAIRLIFRVKSILQWTDLILIEDMPANNELALSLLFALLCNLFFFSNCLISQIFWHEGMGAYEVDAIFLLKYGFFKIYTMLFLQVIKVDHEAHGVDTPEDVEKIESYMRERNLY